MHMADVGYKAQIFVPQSAGSKARLALRINDESVNRSIRLGSIAIYEPVDTNDLPDMPPGTLVVVRRLRESLVETTIRRVSFVSEKLIKLTAHSTDGRFREILNVPINPQGDDIQIIGQVVAKYAEF